MTDEPREGAPKDDWMKALRELEEYDARRGRRRAAEKRLTPPPVGADTPEPTEPAVPLDAGEGAARVTAEERAAGADGNASGMSRYEILCKTPSMPMKGSDIRIMDEMGEILCSVNVAATLVDRFKEKHPDAVPDRRIRRWENALRDVATVMYREFHSLRHGREKKTYDKRLVCRECHSVFMSPLPDGICDQCRSRKPPQPSTGY